MAMVEKPVRPVTGWHVLAIFVGFFGVIIAVNVWLAWQAISTFPGLEVANGYVASQTFDAEMAAQKALGWQLVPLYDAGTDRLTLAFSRAGQPVTVANLTVLVGRPTESVDDVTPVFGLVDGVYGTSLHLGMGKWMMAVTAHAADGTLFRQRIDLRVVR